MTKIEAPYADMSGEYKNLGALRGAASKIRNAFECLLGLLLRLVYQFRGPQRC